MANCGRIRKPLQEGWTGLLDGELSHLSIGALVLARGRTYTLRTVDREYSGVLIRGECVVEIGGRESGILGPRRNPFEDMPSGFIATREELVTIHASQDSLIGLGSAPAERKYRSSIVTTDHARSSERGIGNWRREVRFVCWSDNTEGNLLITGETVTPSGNWSTFPPHRHQYDIPGREVPYEEAYFFQFSRPQGFGLAYQFDDESKLDQAFSLRTDDLLYMGRGYHPVACAPGASLYHLTFIAGPKRVSHSSVHGEYEFLLRQNRMANPFAGQ